MDLAERTLAFLAAASSVPTLEDMCVAFIAKNLLSPEICVQISELNETMVCRILYEIVRRGELTSSKVEVFKLSNHPRVCDWIRENIDVSLALRPTNI